MSESCQTGWCGRNFRPRKFDHHEPIICYDSPPASKVNRSHYDNLRYECLMGDKTQDFQIPKRSAETWEMKKDDLCRITVIEGSQVGDMNFWNLHDKTERFYSGKTRQLHATHLTVYDRLWSCLPHLNPMATIVGDSLKNYGIDKDGGSVHDVIGTRCDDYIYKLITGKERRNSCHYYLTKAVEKIGMNEADVHDVWNIFMCTGFTKDSHQYFCKPSPARKGDYIEFIADMDLVVALSTCPQGDVSAPVGQLVSDDKCHPLGVEVFRRKLKTNIR
ncbi:hypothetical protein RUM44_000839 [Polyplax serrata]|uniref:DUF1989 domain-containing protein n=1 Tax=Polyplax serrata TaxID=468196 RepID=A0ABR1B697_POLSC